MWCKACTVFFSWTAEVSMQAVGVALSITPLTLPLLWCLATSSHREEPWACTDGVVWLQDDVRDTSVGVGAGNGGGLTEVQIGSAVEGEDEGGLACYRYLGKLLDGESLVQWAMLMDEW